MSRVVLLSVPGEVSQGIWMVGGEDEERKLWAVMANIAVGSVDPTYSVGPIGKHLLSVVDW
jgi:hypothetical protein